MSEAVEEQDAPTYLDEERDFLTGLGAGLWRIRVPLPIPALRYVLVYVIEASDGIHLIDAGWNTDVALAALERGLSGAGFSLGDVRSVLVTHVHADHYSLAPRVRELTGARVALHRLDAAFGEHNLADRENFWQRTEQMWARANAPEAELAAMREASGRPFTIGFSGPDVLLEDLDRPEVPGTELVAIWTPGHSPGHLCFYDAGRKVMFTGDHVLPRISPGVRSEPGFMKSALASFLDSLERVGTYDVEMAHPAHQWPFSDLAGRTRALREHHDTRLSEIAAECAEASTAWQIAERVTWSRPWDAFGPFEHRSALGETLAHLEVLVESGVVAERPNGTFALLAAPQP